MHLWHTGFLSQCHGALVLPGMLADRWVSEVICTLVFVWFCYVFIA